MRTIDANQYSAIIANATVIGGAELPRPRVWRDADGRIIKAFYRRRRGYPRWLSYGHRFVRHCRRLARRKVRAPRIEAAYRCPEQAAELVVYPMLTGMAVRDLPPGSPLAGKVLSALPAFLARLHGQGIEFRGVHLGNILHDDADGFAVIDVGYMRFFPWPLHLHARVSGFRNIYRYAEDRALIEAFGHDAFMQRYIDAAGLSRRRAARLLHNLEVAARR